MERRHLPLSLRTTISLEPDYWLAIEALSGGDWRRWTTEALMSKPDGKGRSSWLRCRVLNSYQTQCGAGFVKVKG